MALEKKRSADGRPDPVPRKLMEGMAEGVQDEVLCYVGKLAHSYIGQWEKSLSENISFLL